MYHITRETSHKHKRAPQLTMKDRSAVTYFKVGDMVKVTEDVYKNKQNLIGYQGKVTETWEKCDVDPTCCCAEQVDPGMAVTVSFTQDDDSFIYFFGEDELIKVN